MNATPIAINAARLNRTLEELGRIGETPQGMQRLAFSPADVAGREFTMNLMRRAGLETRIDPAGNIIARKAGADPNLPAIALGSHTDTVPSGGKYDGALGVMGAIEAVQTLADLGTRAASPGGDSGVHQRRGDPLSPLANWQPGHGRSAGARGPDRR